MLKLDSFNVKPKAKKESEPVKQKTEEEIEKEKYDNQVSICLSCSHAFIEKFNFHPPHDTKEIGMNVICRKKVEILGGKAEDISSCAFYMCDSGYWNRKHTECSDYYRKFKYEIPIQ